MSKKSVVIIGAGVIGCSVALHLARKGYKTVNIDKNAEVGFGSTVNSCAVVRFSYSTLDSVKLAYEGSKYWKNWPEFIGIEDESGYAKYIQCGHLVLKGSPQDRQEMLNHYRTIGIPFEEWKLDKILERLPIYDGGLYAPPKPVDDPSFWEDTDEMLAGGIYTPDAGYINDPQLATHNIKCSVMENGGEFLLKRSVTGINKKDGKVTGVTLDNDEIIETDIVVNAAGPHSFVINRMAGVEEGMSVKTKALRREVHHVPSPDTFDFEKEGIVTSDSNIGVYFKPEIGNKITVGSGDPACDEKVWVDDPDTFSRDVSESQWKAQVYRLARRIPSVPIPNSGVGVVDLYDVTDDWTPIYDKSDLDGFYMAVGTSGHQFKNAGVVGALMGELIEATEDGNNQDKNPLQYKCKYTQMTIDTAAFSRLRKLNEKSSFSVRG